MLILVASLHPWRSKIVWSPSSHRSLHTVLLWNLPLLNMKLIPKMGMLWTSAAWLPKEGGAGVKYRLLVPISHKVKETALFLRVRASPKLGGAFLY